MTSTDKRAAAYETVAAYKEDNVKRKLEMLAAALSGQHQRRVTMMEALNTAVEEALAARSAPPATKRKG
jgi:hypothetical protein